MNWGKLILDLLVLTCLFWNGIMLGQTGPSILVIVGTTFCFLALGLVILKANLN